MAWFLVDIQLKILIIYQETTPFLENCKVRIVALAQHIQIVSVGELGADFDRLAMQVWPTQRMNVAIMAILATFAKSCLNSHPRRLQIVMDDFKILEGGKFGVRWQWPRYQVL